MRKTGFYLLLTLIVVSACASQEKGAYVVTQVSEPDGMVMVFVPEGEFLMGSLENDPDAESHETPQHSVYLDAFWIDQTEVTNAMFKKFVNQTGFQTYAEELGSSWIWNLDEQWKHVDGADWKHPLGPDSSLEGLENHPVVIVNWNDARAYCEWAGKRLPTEAEWEKAARGTDGRTYPWGEDNVSGNLLNFADINTTLYYADKKCDDGYEYTAPVGSYQEGASPYGALDMAGNVWEWVADWYGKDYYQNSPAENPPGPTSGNQRVMRGGGFWDDFQDVRSTARTYFNIYDTANLIGFRCASSP